MKAVPPEKCRHDVLMSERCDDCVTDSHVFGKSIGAEHGLTQAMGLISEYAGKLFLDNHDEQAKTARAIVERLRAAHQTQKDESEKIRRTQKLGGR